MIIDCPSIAKSFDAKLQVAVQQVRDSGTTPRMCEIVATQTQSTLSYSTTKKRKAVDLGIQYETLKFGQDVHLSEILEKIPRFCNAGAKAIS
jgi:5,10-methylene-tetrahydrofolate dehydrogenase/methenyl tetrahydrofolate cyclohydrolase